MPRLNLRIWCNQALSDDAQHLLQAETVAHELIFAQEPVGNLAHGGSDARLRDSDVAFGQPDINDLVQSTRLKWIHLSAAGYTRYDRADVREALQRRGGAMTNSSSVYADPCAQHVLAMMLAFSRRLPQALLAQQPARWDYDALRPSVRVLTGQSVVIVGFGAIGRRLVELLAPFQMKIIGLRRSIRGDEPVEVRAMSEAASLLSIADHIVDLLPSGANTSNFINVSLMQTVKPGAFFYNVGRGDTVDQNALIDALRSGKLAGAYLDVTTPEPLPPDHPLWTAPNCHITPHIAGGHQAESRKLVEHFLMNLRRYERGETLRDGIFQPPSI